MASQVDHTTPSPTHQIGWFNRDDDSKNRVGALQIEITRNERTHTDRLGLNRLIVLAQIGTACGGTSGTGVYFECFPVFSVSGWG